MWRTLRNIGYTTGVFAKVAVTLAVALGDGLEAVGGHEYLNALSVSVPSARNVARYAEIVRETATLRGLEAAHGLLQSRLARELRISLNTLKARIRDGLGEIRSTLERLDQIGRAHV